MTRTTASFHTHRGVLVEEAVCRNTLYNYISPGNENDDQPTTALSTTIHIHETRPDARDRRDTSEMRCEKRDPTIPSKSDATRSDARDSTDHFHTDKADMRTHTHITHAHDHGASRVCSAHERGHDTHDLTTRDTTYAERDPRTTLRAPLTPTRGVPRENTVTECTQMRGTPTHTTCLSPRPEATTARHGQHHHHHTPT